MQTHQTDFSKGNVYRNIMEVAVPMIIAQILNLLYNIVDRIYIGRIQEIGATALTGVGLCFPIITLITAFTYLFGNGGSPLCSMERGRGNEKEAEMLMGTSTAGIAHAAIAATLLDMPMGYVRSSAKDHGRTNRIEGRMEPGTKVVVIEDLISTGGSCIEVVEALREAGAEVLGIVSIFTYGMQKGIDRIAAAHTVNYSLSNLDALVEAAVEENYIAPEWKDRIIAFRNNPSDESWIK